MFKLRQSRPNPIRRLVFILPPLLLTGCLGLSDGTELIVPEASGPAPTQIQVSSGLTPTYSWRVGSASSIFVVRTSSPNTPIWGISAQGAADIINSPITHGDIPDINDPSLAAMNATPETPLSEGVEYRVTITTQGGFQLYSTTFFVPDGTGVPTSTPGNNLAANTHSLAIMDDGTIQAWGSNQAGQLGNGETVQSPSPLTVNGLANVLAIASGGSHSLAVTAEGTVWSWGANDSGQLGNGTNSDSAIPLQVTGLHDITVVAAGERHSLALDKSGKVWAWGENSSGQLGDGTTINHNIPAAVKGPGKIVSIAAGKVHSMAVTQDGTVWAWGGNYNGQLGNGTAANSPYPIQVKK